MPAGHSISEGLFFCEDDQGLRLLQQVAHPIEILLEPKLIEAAKLDGRLSRSGSAANALLPPADRSLEFHDRVRKGAALGQGLMRRSCSVPWKVVGHDCMIGTGCNLARQLHMLKGTRLRRNASSWNMMQQTLQSIEPPGVWQNQRFNTVACSFITLSGQSRNRKIWLCRLSARRRQAATRKLLHACSGLSVNLKIASGRPRFTSSSSAGASSFADAHA